MNPRTKNDDARARALAELIERLGRISHLRGYYARLNPAQWSALRFLARANDSARTTTGFARANGTTQGTATQTISALVRKNLVTRTQSRDDARVMLLDLTAQGRALLTDDPLNDLVALLRNLPVERAGPLARELAELNQKFGEPRRKSENSGS